MSWLPFVSRARYEDLAKRMQELEEERRMLLDRVLVASGSTPIFTATPAPVAPAPAAVEEKKDEGDAQQHKPRLFAHDIRRLAEEGRAGKTPARVGA